MLKVNAGVETLVEKKCGTCGIWFAVPDWFGREAVENGPRGGWTCPNGHSRHYSEGKQEKEEIVRLRDKVRAEQDNAAFWRSQTDKIERRLSAQKGQVTKLKKRIGKGTCPCCNRHFANVERHMASQHPEFADEGAVE